MQALLNQAIGYFQSGDYKAAAELCEKHLPASPMFELILASSLGKLGRIDEAHTFFDSLTDRYPTNPDVWFNQALIFIDAADFSGAENALNKCLSINAGYHPAWHSFGELYAREGEFKKAEEAYRKALSLAMGHPAYIVSLANLQLAQGQAREALKLLSPLLKTALSLNVAEAALIAFYQLSERDKASALFASAINCGLQSFTLFYYGGLIEVEEKRYYHAMQLLSKAGESAVPPERRTGLMLNLAFCRFMLNGDSSELQTLSATSANWVAEDQLFLARLYESIGEHERCASILGHLNAEQPASEHEVRLIQAQSAMAQKDFKQAGSLVSGLGYLNSENEEVRCLKIRLADKTGDFAAAARLMVEGALKSGGDEFARRFVNDVEAALPGYSAMTASSPTGIVEDKPVMVFIVGFPRSGTTLLETRLAALPGCKVLEETTLLRDCYERVRLISGGEEPAVWLARQSEQVRQHWRKEYFAMMQFYIGGFHSDDWILDKMPFNCLYLPFLRILFPQAKVIWAHRHPKDIFISCLQQEALRIYNAEQFGMVFSAYLSIWDQTMKFQGEWLFQLRYEAMVENMTSTLEQLISWASLPQQLGPTQERLVITPSYQDVRQSVNGKAVLRHRHYSLFTDLWSSWSPTLTERLGYH